MESANGKLEFVDLKTKELCNYAEQFRNYLNALLRTINTISNYIDDANASNQIREIGNEIFDISKNIPQKYADYAKKISHYVFETRENINIALSELDTLDREIDDCISDLIS